MSGETTLEQRIECLSGKLFARMTPHGIKFWCEKHRREELRTWEQLDVMRRSLTEAQQTISTQPTIR